jgi:hypothetical protein
MLRIIGASQSFLERVGTANGNGSGQGRNTAANNLVLAEQLYGSQPGG